MNKYYIYKLENGIPKKKQELHALNINSAWIGSKNWFYNGLFLVTNSDGTEAKNFILNREV